MTQDTKSRRTIIAFFDDREDASGAIERLAQAGIPRSDINMISGPEREESATRNYEEFGFWTSLKDVPLPNEDRYTYAEGLRRGGHVVIVRASEAKFEQAMDILSDAGAVNLDEREASWRSEGWTGYSGASAGRSSAGVRGQASPHTSDREEVIPITEEELKVGKREVSQGRVRVRSYVVETPVTEQVNLREERVQVERRPVDRPVAGDEGLFRERTIEAEERAEESVVSKEARIKEELALKKDVTQRTDTVSDKVRRTEVEVEDERGKRTRSGGEQSKR